MNNNEIYEPREDSFLILNNVIKECEKDYSICDMGTGSGVIGLGVIGKVKKITMVDINPLAIKQLKDRIEEDENIQIIESDFFENIDEEFDLISFNAPYLPDDPKVKDIALDGGKEGYEVTLKFLESAKNHLKENGKIILLISTLTKIDVVEKFLEDNNYSFEIIDRENVSFETLLVYRITNK